MRTFARLGADKPHKPVRSKNEELGSGQRLLSPSESGAAQTAQQSIDVKPEDQNPVELADVEGAETSAKPQNGITPAAPSPELKRKGRPPKSQSKAAAAPKPYEGLFSATINDASPPVVEIRDLRENVSDGEKTWTEPLHCLLCSTEIH